MLVGGFLVEAGLFLAHFPTEYQTPTAYRPNLDLTFKNLEYTYTLKTNDQGLRERVIPLERRPDRSRVLVIGDSFTEGLGVDAADTFSRGVEKRLARVSSGAEFINCGISGAGPLQYGRLLFSVGVKYHPDGVLLCYYANDLINTYPGYRPDDLFITATRKRFLWMKIGHSLYPRLYTLLESAYFGYHRRQAGQKNFVQTAYRMAADRGIPKNDVDDWLKRIPPALMSAVKRGEFNGALILKALLQPNYFRDSLDMDRPEAEARFKAMMRILNRIADELKHRGIELAMVYVPFPLQYSPNAHKPDSLGQVLGYSIRDEWLRSEATIQKRLAAWTNERKIPFLDLTSTLRKAEKKQGVLTIALDGHWNIEGHRVVAKRIADWIETGAVFSFIPASGDRNPH